MVRACRKSCGRCCESERVEFHMLGESWAVGTLRTPSHSRERNWVAEASPDWVLEKGLPLDPARIVKRVLDLTRTMLEPPRELKSLAVEVKEAMRVTLARQGLPVTSPELCAELPQVYREMVYVKQGKSKPATKTSFKDYSRARFVVELKTLMQSEENTRADRRLKLEPAVIENAKRCS